MEELFTWQFNNKLKLKSGLTKQVTEHLKGVDLAIQKCAPERPLAQINRIDLAILRLAIFELIQDQKTPYKVVVDEAVELGKLYGADSSPAFINGVLGKVISEYHLDKS